jgi:hypothetical protein
VESIARVVYREIFMLKSGCFSFALLKYVFRMKSCAVCELKFMLVRVCMCYLLPSKLYD